MKRSSLFVDFSLLRLNPRFRAIFLARLMSVLALGILNVAVPLQMYQLTGSTLQVGLAVTLDGAGMFVGLLCGGVLADRHDRRRLILLARGLCGAGFLLLALNSAIAAPSVTALLLVACWDGFFGAIGISALMAALPGIVGREHLAAAGALSMLVVRLGAVLAPAVGGLLMAVAGAGGNYLLAGIGTLATLLPLLRLPPLPPPASAGAVPPLRALGDGLAFLRRHRVLGPVLLLGTLQTMLASLRILFPALAAAQGSAAVGLMYAALPLGAMLAAFGSGWLRDIRQPGRLLLLAVLLSGLAVLLLGLCGALWPALLALVLFGYLLALASLLQFMLIQTQTPDALLGRVNSLYSAQGVLADAGGALGLGLLAGLLSPALALAASGLTLATLTLLLALGAVALRRA